MFPVGDELPTLRTPWMNYVILGIMWAVWLLVEGGGTNQALLAARVCDLGMVPGELTRLAPLGSGVPVAPGMACVVDNYSINALTPLTSMFLHGGWMHIIGNSLFLWVFGNNVEDSMGPVRYLAFYLICGFTAAAAHVFSAPASPVPTVGASGAISGVMGAYLLLYPRARIKMLFIFIIFFRVFHIPAWLVLLWWFAVQVISGLPELSDVNAASNGGVAVWAHVGGFVAGVVLIKLFSDERLVLRHKQIHGARYGY
ncbi:MAG TPA: rhomboid family intramembrane serine protease [Gemmatimonadaceae bacterium]